MDLSAFFIEFLHDEEWVLAEIKPCCSEDDVFYYDVSINNQFQYTITNGNPGNNDGWKIALMNADKYVDPNVVTAMGKQIEMHYVV